jgi:RimJ/RimL family protein N-acetyltransferase
MSMIWTIRESDAEEFLALSNRLDEETAFRLFEPGERRTTVEEQREIIGRCQTGENDVILVAECDGQLVGYIAAIGGKYRRNRHSVHVVVAVLQSFAGQGIGTKLFEELEKWAGECQLHRLELTVMAHNERAIRLYKRMGFEIEGRKRHSLLVNGSYVDEYCMSKLLP